jgi:hypothetical protein
MSSQEPSKHRSENIHQNVCPRLKKKLKCDASPTC